MPDICIHHHPCADGFTAAWCIWHAFPQTRFVPGIYGQEPPDVTGLDVLLVDFSYKRPVLERMAAAAKSLTILDHHKTAQADLAPLLESGAVQGCFDMDRSGARLAWEWAFPGRTVPQLVRYVEDRDLWRFAMPQSRLINAAIFSHDYTFEGWNALDHQLSSESGRDAAASQGEAIDRKHRKDLRELLAETSRTMVIAGVEVRVANLPYTFASDGAGQLADGAPFGATYFDRADGSRVFSLRSREGGADVSAIAAQYGGGGHARAAGFSAPCGWEGDAAYAGSIDQHSAEG